MQLLNVKSLQPGVLIFFFADLQENSNLNNKKKKKQNLIVTLNFYFYLFFIVGELLAKQISVWKLLKNWCSYKFLSFYYDNMR